MSTGLPSSLVERLRKDEVQANQLLTTGLLEEAVQTVKTSADRKLLSLTSKAVDTLEEVMDTSAPKERIAAATAILDRSPATKQNALAGQSEASIPLDALKGALEGMAKIFAIKMEHTHTEIRRVAPEPAEPALPEPKIAPKRSKKRA